MSYPKKKITDITHLISNLGPQNSIVKPPYYSLKRLKEASDIND